MVKENLKKINEKTKKIWLKASAIIASVEAIILTSSTRVFAATTTAGTDSTTSTGGVSGASSITVQTPSSVAQQIFVANQGIAAAFGGALVGIAVVVIGIKMLMASKKQEARSEAMDSILTVIIAALLLGGFALFAGLIWGMSQK